MEEEWVYVDTPAETPKDEVNKDIASPHMSAPRPSPSPAPTSAENDNEQTETVLTEFRVVERNSNGETSNVAAAESPSTSGDDENNNVVSNQAEIGETTGLDASSAILMLLSIR